MEKNVKNNNNKIILFLCAAIVVICILTVVFVDKGYTVKFNVDGGTIVTEQNIKKGDNPSIPEDPVKENYIFVGWLYNGEPFDFSIPLDGNVTLTANWVPVEEGVTKYVVKFDSQGGTTILNQIMNDGETVTIPSDPVKSGYEFLEWTLDGNVYDFSLPVSSDIMLVAKYVKAGDSNLDDNNSSNNQSVESIDTSIVVPELFYEKQMALRAENGVYLIDFGVNHQKYNCNFSVGSVKCDVDGFEIYEKNGKSYKSLGSNELGGAVSVEVPVGEKKVYVARVFISNKNGKKVYSSYSKELTIDKTNYSAPEISYEKQMALRPENGVYLIDFSVNNKQYNCNFMSNNVECDVDGFEIFEKTGEMYKSLGSNELGGAVPVEVSVGTKKVLVARVFVFDKNKNKVYSPYSKEVVIDKTKYSTPELFYEKQMALRAENGVYFVDFGVNNKNYNCNFTINRVECEVSGFELYEKNGSTYKLLGSNTVDGAVAVEIPVGTKKTYVARVFVLDKNKKKIYTSYSKEVIIDKTSYSAPELSYDNQMGLIPEDGVYLIDLGVNNQKYNCNFSAGSVKCDVDGFEIYEKNGDSYKSLGSNELGGAVSVEVPVGEKKVLVARVFVFDKNKNKVYSSYSNVVVIDKTTFDAPTLLYQKQMIDYCSDDVCVVDFHVKNDKYGCRYLSNGVECDVPGFEIYEKTGSTYKSLGSNTVDGAVAVEIPVGTKKVYVARVYVLKKDGNKLYSDYSSEVVLDRTK